MEEYRGARKTPEREAEEDSDIDLFRHLTVLSQEQALALTYCTFRLAMKGIRVIRLEPLRGDPNRHVGFPLGNEKGMNSYFLPVNAGKKCVTLDLSGDEGKEILSELITRLPVDIFCTNQLPGNYDRLGVSYERIRSIREDIIWVGLSGFGPERSEPAYDPMIQAMTGLMDETGEPERDPMTIGVPIVDLGAGNNAYTAIMEALYKREKTGRGSRIDISMAQGAVSLLATKIPNVRLGEPAGRFGNRHRFFAPVDTYPTQDGYVLLAVGSDLQWESFSNLPGFESLRLPAYRTNAGRMADVDVLNDKIRALTQTRTTEEMVALCRQAGVPASRVNNIHDVLADPYFAGLMWQTADARTGMEITLAPPPVEIPYRPERRLPFAPRLGEHNDEIYGGILGYGADKLRRLRESKVIS